MELAIVFWLMCGGVAALITSSKGGSGCLGFAAGALLGPFGIIAAFFMGSDANLEAKEIRAGEKRKCPQCAEIVQAEAKVCKHCGFRFEVPDQAAEMG